MLRGMNMHKYKLVNKFRFYCFILIVVSLLFSGIISITRGSVQGEAIDKYEIVTVEYGDTLWDIASKYNKNKHKDLREFIYIIKKENNLNGSFLIPSQVIKIPTSL